VTGKAAHNIFTTKDNTVSLGVEASRALRQAEVDAALTVM